MPLREALEKIRERASRQLAEPRGVEDTATLVGICTLVDAALASSEEQGLREAFVQGAKWWEFESRGATMWQSDQQKAWDAAECRKQDGTLGVPWPSFIGGVQ